MCLLLKYVECSRSVKLVVMSEDLFWATRRRGLTASYNFAILVLYPRAYPRVYRPLTSSGVNVSIERVRGFCIDKTASLSIVS